MGPTCVVHLNPPVSIPGLHIASHRAVYTHQQVESIPTSRSTRESIYSPSTTEPFCKGIGRAADGRTNYSIKESLISLALFGYGNEVVRPNDEYVALYRGFLEPSRRIMPASLGFQGLSIEPPDVLVKTSAGTFSLDAVSGGIASVIDVAWQLFRSRHEW